MADRFWVGGSGNWSDATNHWATTTGGAPGAGNLPTAADNAIFDTLSNAVGYTVTIDSAAVCLDLTFGAPLTGTITLGGATLSIYGNATLLSGMTVNAAAILEFKKASGTQTFQPNAVFFPEYIKHSGGGTLQLLGALSTLRISHTAGVFDANGQTVTIGTTSGVIAGTFTGTSAFFNLTLPATMSGTLFLNGDIEVTGTLTAAGASASSRPLFYSSVTGTPRTITAAAVSLTDVDFTDITGAGAASPFTGTRIGDCKGNSGITFTAAANKYYVGNTNNWNTANVWALTSGGAGATNNYPLPQDTAVLDAGSFSANGQTLTINSNFRIGTLTCSGTDQTYTLAWGTSVPIIYGDITFDANTTNSGNHTSYLSGRNTQTITSNGRAFSGSLILNSLSGTAIIADNCSCVASSVVSLGTFDLNGKTITASTFLANGSSNRTIKSGTNGGKIVTSDTTVATVFNASTTTNLTIDRATGTWTIEIGGNTTNIRTINLGAGISWPAISFTNTTAGGELDIVSSGAATVIKSLTVTNPAQTIKRTAGTTITIEDNNGFPSGTVGNLVTIGSITAASHTWAKSGGGQISSDYLSISYSTATPASTWYAGANSTNGGNNSGWNFTVPPTGSTAGLLPLMMLW